VADFQLSMADFASGGGALGLPGVTTPAGYISPSTQAAGASLATQSPAGTDSMAGFFGAILAPFSQGLADRISGKYNAPAVQSSPASATSPGMIALYVALGVGALILALVLIHKA